MPELLKNSFVYVGTYTVERPQGDRYVTNSEGIYCFEVDDNGEWVTKQTIRQLNPMYLLFNQDKTVLYSTSSDSNKVYAYSILDDGTLELLNHSSVNGHSTLCLSSNHRNTFLVVGTMSGTVETIELEENGSLGDLRFHMQIEGSPGPFKAEQPWPRAHETPFFRDSSLFFIVDKGQDAVLSCQLDESNGTFQVINTVKLKPASLPRHMAFHPHKQIAYVLCENIGTIVACYLNPERAILEPFQEVQTLPISFKGYNLASEIQVHSSGKYLIASNRGHDSLVRFEITDEGNLNDPTWFACGGEVPRHFTLDSTEEILLVANQKSGSIRQLYLSSDNRQMVLSPFCVSSPTPVWIAIKPK